MLSDNSKAYHLTSGHAVVDTWDLEDIHRCSSCGAERLDDTGKLPLEFLDSPKVKRPQNFDAVQPRDRDYQYLIEYMLGGGGVGMVYRARRSTDGLLVALKLPAYMHDRIGRASVMQEIEALTSLNHPYIVKALDHGETDQGEPYLAMELLDGETLDKRLRRDGPLSLQQAARIGLELAQAIEHAHSAGFVHCDLKPSNIFLVGGKGNDEVRLIDFGISESESGGLSKTGKVKCATVLYMSPEQHALKKLTGSSDVYQVGLILFESLFGELPFYTSLESALQYRVSGDLVPAVSSQAGACLVPRGIKSLLQRALARDPHERHGSVRELIEELQAFALPDGAELEH